MLIVGGVETNSGSVRDLEIKPYNFNGLRDIKKYLKLDYHVVKQQYHESLLVMLCRDKRPQLRIL